MELKTDLIQQAQQFGVFDELTMSSILDLAHFRFYVIDVTTRDIIYANHSNQLHQSPGAVKCHQLIYQSEQPCLSCKIGELVDAQGKPNGRVHTSERFNEVEDCWFQLQEGTLTLADGRTAMYSIATDISEVKRMQNSLAEAHAELTFKNQLLENLMVTDTLTGLFNRRKLDEVLSQECERASRTGAPLAVILADIDNFKSVNDLYGHQTGDQLLVAFATLLQQGVRKVDTVARWGGEEFMILCPDTDLAGACTVAESIRSAVARHGFATVGRKTCSFGVSEYRPGDSPQAIIKRADGALYAAKHGGRNQVCAAD